MVVHFLLQGFSVTPLVQLRFLANNANEIHFEIAFLSQKGVQLSLYSYIIGWTWKTIHTLLNNLWEVFTCFYVNIHTILQL